MGASLLRLWLMTTGIGVGAVVSSPQADGLVVPIVALGLAAAGVRRRPGLLLLGLFLFGLGTGLWAASVRNGGEALRVLSREVPFCDASGTILENAGGLGTLATLEWVSCDGTVVTRPGVAIVETGAAPGSAFAASGWLLPLGTDRFDVARARAGAQAELATEELTTTPPTGLPAVAASIRDGLRAGGRQISHERAGLIRGLTIGDTDGLSRLTIENFRRSGLSHLLAVSGSNVAIVLAGVALVVARLSFRTRLIAGAIGLFVFVLVVGPDASVLRAAAMGGIGLFALATGRQAEPLHALGVALMVIVLLRPQIVFAVGLHLSIAATAGIILWAARIEQRVPLPLIVCVPLAVTLSAQVAVLPVLVGVFGEVSIVAPVTNLLAAAAVAPATVFGLLGALAGTVHPWIGGLVLRLAEPFTAWILLVGNVGAQPSWATLAVPNWVGAVLGVPVGYAALWTLRRYGAPISLER